MHRKLFVLVATLTSAASLADAPLPPPSDTTVCNTAKTFCAVATTTDSKTTLYKVEGEKRSAVWSVPAWSRSLFVSEDGKYVAHGYGGLNLISNNDQPHTVMVEFFSAGKSVAKVELKDLVRDLSKMPRTASHYSWGSVSGFDRSGAFLVELYDGSEVKLDPATGKSRN